MVCRWFFSRSLRLLAAMLVAGGSGACATEPGQPWGALALEARTELHVPADRLVQGGWVRTAAGYGLRLDSVQIDVREVAVRVRTSTGGSGGFDPAKPPTGYSLCHNGHCHRDDGALIDYAEIEADLLASTGATPAASGVVLALAESPLATAQGGEVALPACGADERCALPRGQLATATVRVASLRVSGAVRDLDANRLAGQDVGLDLTIDLGGDAAPAGISAQLAGTLGNGSPAGVNLLLRLVVEPLWLDAVDVASAVGDDGVLKSSDLANQIDDLRERARSSTSLLTTVLRVDL